MTDVHQDVVVLGGGTAGLMAAMAVKRAFPSFSVKVVYSPDIDVIGVGESTTVLLPPFLHQSLGLDRDEFFREVRPSWKLGIQFQWGDPNDTHFNYPFDRCMSDRPAPLRKLISYYSMNDMSDASRFSGMMDRGLSPCFLKPDGHYAMDPNTGYHIDNKALIGYLRSKLPSIQIETIHGRLEHVVRDANGRVEGLRLDSGQTVAGTLFLDCSGFKSLLLGKELAEAYCSYADSLFCDRAIVGQWRRDRPVLPFTVAETMENGWCWQIDFPHHVSRGYVFCSQFCGDDEAADEFRNKNPLLEESLRMIPFRSGRYERFWVDNIAALGNSSGFVEPLEASALHVLVEQIRLLCRILDEGDGLINPAIQQVGNQRFRELWDEVRDFLAIHYRFNRRIDSPFWRHCQRATDLAGAEQLVEYYRNAGPSTLCGALLPSGRIFGYDGFMTLLIGQRVKTRYANPLSDDDIRMWDRYREQVRQRIRHALPMEAALKMYLGDGTDSTAGVS